MTRGRRLVDVEYVGSGNTIFTVLLGKRVGEAMYRRYTIDARSLHFASKAKSAAPVRREPSPFHFMLESCSKGRPSLVTVSVL